MSAQDPDIREKVEDSRGFLKKLQLLVPGLRGYRKLEDIRVSDELLRNQIADALDQARANLNILRQKLASYNDLQNLSQVGSLVAQIQTLSGEIRHAQQGYSGFVAPISINEEKLDSLYEYDYTFVSSALRIRDQTNLSNINYDPSSPSSLTTYLTDIVKQVQDIRSMWSQRLEKIEGILIGGR